MSLPHTRVIVLDSRPYYLELQRKAFSRAKYVDEMLYASTLEEALEWCDVNQEGEDDDLPNNATIIILVCGYTFLQLFSVLNAIATIAPHVSVCLLTETCCPLCSFLADRCRIHCWCSSTDSPTDVLRSINRLARGIRGASSQLTTFVVPCEKRLKLVGKEEHRSLVLYHLSPQEWICFTQLVNGIKEAELHESLKMAKGSLKNLKQRLRGKFGVQRTMDIYFEALAMGIHGK